MKNEINEIAMQAIEFWSNVCEEELNLAAETEEVKKNFNILLFLIFCCFY